MGKDSTFLPRSGNKIPVMGLGTWLLNLETAPTIAYALELGYNLIDTSSDYGTQPGIGQAVKASGRKREDVYLVSKVEEMDDAYDRARSNLTELDTPYLDLLLVHRPPPGGAGIDLWRELIKAKKDGLTRDIGVSNYPEHQIDALIEETDEVPAVNQIEWSPFGHSTDMKQYCDDKKIAIMAYSPLTHGRRLEEKKLEEMGKKHDKSPAQVLIRWCLEKGTVPIPKANDLEHMHENRDVFDFELTPEEMEALDSLNEDYSSLGSLAYV